MTTFKKPYKPTSWLISSHFHTAYGMRYRPRSLIMGSERREMFLFSDGGTSALDYFEPKDATNSPFVVLAHTLGGGTREPVINNLAEACNKKGWRVVVANGRGSSGAPITSARLPSCLDWDDLNEIINHIRELYHPPYIFLAGFSLGALQSMEYSTKDAALDIDGIAAVSHTYDLLKGALVLEKPIQMRLYTPIICHQLHHALEKSKQFFDEPAAMNSRTMREFDDVFTSKKKGFPNGIEYYKAGNIYSKIDNAKVPTLVLGADDDPFTVKDAMPIKEARASKNVAFAHTAEGGHVSFITGNDGLHSLIDEMIPEWFQVIMDEKKKND
ncbi:Clan SC, family S33, methylesterase-like serine peptidase [Histomonas meleagridis]|uniref:Clan SC, family S33, methylesterase-like serine peptidase n=1 Tax=Histomonas meleagridis TaxID=135588 RepID=UPI00355A99F8|nr:Clan SC, family S33, methylesterase-like serine peptidase [Histomonas meleagridis]KAH0798315.1 Clan SC, family S33, methylesterase-like serine peptidase [Histomonas meleagridis]